jgi:hypothetical protein
MKRRPIVVLLVVTLSAAVAMGAWARSHRTHLVRVGGMGNACTCTQRIEP